MLLTWSDVLHELDSLSTHREAETELVLLHDHTPLDKTGTWETFGGIIQRRQIYFKREKYTSMTALQITGALCKDVDGRLLLLGGRGFALRVADGQAAEPGFDR